MESWNHIFFQYRKSVLVGVGITFTILPVIVVGLRFYARRFTRAAIGMDDWSILFALILCTGAGIVEILAAEIGGMGQHQQLGPQGELIHTPELTNYEKCRYISAVITTINLGIIKISILLFYLLQTNITLFASAFMARNAACAWNDNLDVEYDRQVFRCRLRPIARGAITPLNGYIYAAALFVLWVGIMAILSRPHLKYTIPYVLFNILYPLSKRFTYYTPACIGFTIAIGVFIGSSVLGLDVVELRTAGSGRTVAAIGCLYAATGTWTIVYEGTYSFQDLKDDLKAGIMSLAVGHHHHAKQLLSSMAALQLTLLIITGVLTDAGPLYFAGACGGTAASLAYMLWSVDLARPEDCWWWFRDGHWFVGCSIAIGFLAEYLSRRYNAGPVSA